MLVVVLILGAVVVSGATTPELLERQAATAITGPQECLDPLDFARDTVYIPDLRFTVNVKINKLTPKLQNTTGCIPRLSTSPDGSCPVSTFQQVRFSPST